MTTTTPESRARIAYTAYGRAQGFEDRNGDRLPVFDELEPKQRDGWIKAANTLWDLAKTGRATI